MLDPGIKSIIDGEVIFNKCICDSSKKCIEKGKIVWDNKRGEFIHFRYDGCICSSNKVQKSDCLIFFENEEEKIKIFAIEVKDKNPAPREVQSQIQTCLDHMDRLLSTQQNKTVIIPVLCAERYTGTIKRYLQTLKVRCFGKPYNIVPIKHGEEIIASILD